MSADNGFIIRETDDGKYALQAYFASADTLPEIEKATEIFDTLEEAARAYAKIEDTMNEFGGYIEYGLSIRLKKRPAEDEG